MSQGLRTLLALVMGVAIGTLATAFDLTLLERFAGLIEPVGTLWVNAIRMTVIPLMVAMIVRGIATQRDTATTGRLSGRTLLWFAVLIAGTTTFAALVAPALLQFMPAQTGDIAGVAGATAQRAELPPFRDWLIGLVPANPIRAAADGAILPLAVFSIIFGLALARVRLDLREPLVQIMAAIVEALFAVVEWVLRLAPIGVFALSLSVVVRTGTAAAGMFGFFIVLSCVLVVIAMLALYPLTAWFTRVPMRTFARACGTAQAVAFTSRSSLAALPAMMKGAEVLHLPQHISALVLPLAVSVFKFGSPIVRIVGTLFVARLFGIPLGVAETAGIALGIGILSFYSPGIPSGGLLVITPLYESLGLPGAGIGLLIALDAIPDMFLTTANVTGDMAVAALVSQSEGRSVTAGVGDGVAAERPGEGVGVGVERKG
jgi:Na+/H+-dicarboxylate symporter